MAIEDQFNQTDVAELEAAFEQIEREHITTTRAENYRAIFDWEVELEDLGW